MNVYDFDNTIYDGDCTLDFWRYCVKKNPKVLISLPCAIAFFILNRLGLCNKSLFKEKFYSFLKFIPDVNEEICAFWDDHIVRIKLFYREQCQKDDLVISASPEFLVYEACLRLKIRCIASKVNPFTGKLEGPNCYGIEKVHRFRNAFPSECIQNFYSDSLSDVFLAREARSAFLIKRNQIIAWSV